MKTLENQDVFAKWFGSELQRSPKTQQEIARECGLSRSYITMLKTKGIKRLPSPGTLFLLAQSLGADIDKAFEAAGLEMPENLRLTIGPRVSQLGTAARMEIEIANLRKLAVK